jgi:hypothetical protein
MIGFQIIGKPDDIFAMYANQVKVVGISEEVMHSNSDCCFIKYNYLQTSKVSFLKFKKLPSNRPYYDCQKNLLS